jgi:diadenylate cyclase
MVSRKEQQQLILESAITLARESGAERMFVFLNSEKDAAWIIRTGMLNRKLAIAVLPRSLEIDDSSLKEAGLRVIRSWSGNQSRFSRIKYAFLQGVLSGIITPESKVVCLLGPWGKSHLDTVTVHDLSLSWSEDFPFEPETLLKKRTLGVVMAVVDIALDIGALGREGKSIGTTFVIGDSKRVLQYSHQAVFNPFKGYPEEERYITRPEVVESLNELAQLDGAFVISSKGIVEAAGRHLDTAGTLTKQLRGLGSRHRAAAGVTRRTSAVAVVVSESTGRVTIFEKGRIVSTLEPVISRRVV